MSTCLSELVTVTPETPAAMLPTTPSLWSQFLLNNVCQVSFWKFNSMAMSDEGFTPDEVLNTVKVNTVQGSNDVTFQCHETIFSQMLSS